MTNSLDYVVLDIEKKAIDADPADLLTYMPGHMEAMDQHTLKVIKNLIAECREIMEPKGGFVVREAIPSQNKEEIFIPGTRFHTGKTIVKMVKGASQIVFFLATIGPGPERLSRSLIAGGQYLEGYIADLIGSILAEATAQYVHDFIKETRSTAGLKITNRYSPGYCGWKVDEQQKLFGLFPEGSCGITLSESSLMSPIKSISAMVGAGQKVNFRDYTCEICSMKNCTFRRTRDSHPSL